MRRLLVTAVLALALLVPLAGPAAAQAGDTDSTERTEPSSQVPTQDIIPEPNSGREPTDAGDRGGALQTVLFIGLVVVIGAGGYALVRQSRRARAERGF